jgi:hypothetical protein
MLYNRVVICLLKEVRFLINKLISIFSLIIKGLIKRLKLKA